ncbi:MAG: asparagine synthase-related protein [Rhodocyclaceae bacterium]|nr:asparagine synthase-related protein [Rhodocyclaceae bacterium]
MGYVAGVVGAIGEAAAKDIVARMAAAMSFRRSTDLGPVAISGGQGGANLALVGAQTLGDTARGVWAVLEGEIYDTGLHGRDTTIPQTSAAPGVLVDLMFRAGRDFPRAINGAYTAALWHRGERTLYLVRDHAGCRSIYFSPVRDGIVFASTAAAVLASGLVDGCIDPASVDAYFGVKALSPPRTMFKNVFALRPGHVLVWKDGLSHQHDYWRLHEIREDHRTPPEVFAEVLQATIKDAVKIRQQAGGNYCALVSGGVDTSAVATILTQMPGTPRPLRGLSIAFDEMAYSDAGLQDIIVKSLGVDQGERVLTPADFADTLSQAVGFLDSPVNDAAMAGMHAVFGMARGAGYDVVFDGEGPDELFPAGNTHGERGIGALLRLPQPLRRASFGLLATSMPIGDSLPERIRRMCARLALPDDERRMTWRPLFHTAARRQLLSRDYCTGIDPYAVGKNYLGLTALEDPLNLYQYGLIKTFLPDDLLYKNERMATAHNIMNRTPLVDRRLVELALRIPSRFQIEKPTPNRDGIKLLYKAALRGIVPDEIIDRKKERGFSQPTRVWFAGPLKDFLHDRILGARATARSIFNTAFLQRLFDEHASGKANHDAILTAVLIFDLWLDAQES